MKTTYTYDKYLNYEAMTACLNELSARYSDLFTLESIAQTQDLKNQWVVTLSGSTQKSNENPALYIDANIHAGEVTGMMTALYTIDILCTNYATNPRIQKLLDDYTFYIIPMVSPDGVDAYLNGHEKLRSVNRAYPYEKRQDGLHPQDIDGDGAQRMMRVQSEYGAWKASSADPRIMTKRLPNDIGGTYYHVYPEGFIENYDGLHVTLAPNKWGLDFNRNFPFGWFSEIRQPGAGKYPLSNTETKTLADFVLTHPNIGFVNALHTTGGVLIYPPGTYSEKQAIQKDMKLFHQLGVLAKEKTGYETKNIFDAFLVDTDNYSSGAFDDWCYETQGIPAFTIELWDCLLRAGVTYDDIRATHKTDAMNEDSYTKTVQWVDQNLGSEAFTNWKPFVHPQLGAVEIGGFDFKFVVQNPPEIFLQQEVEKMGAYLVESAFALPKLSLPKVSVEALDENWSKLEVYVGNTGFMSTNLTEKAIIQKTSQPVHVSIEGVEVFKGTQPTQSIGNLQGYGSLDSNYGYDAITTVGVNDQIKKVEFVIKNTPQQTIKISATHPKAGKVETVITT